MPTKGGIEQQLEATLYAQEVIQLEDSEMHPATEIFSQVPEDAEVYVEESETDQEEARTLESILPQPAAGIQCECVCLMAVAPKVNVGQVVRNIFARRLIMNDRTHKFIAGTDKKPASTPERRIASEQAVLNSRRPLEDGTAVAFVATTGAEGVVVTGASRTVVGSERVRQLLQGISQARLAAVKKVSSQVTFRFGIKTRHFASDGRRCLDPD